MLTHLDMVDASKGKRKVTKSKDTIGKKRVVKKKSITKAKKTINMTSTNNSPFEGQEKEASENGDPLESDAE
eukprot:14326233-Ditylum_brightwellii.AAC.1